ncbi:MAG: acetylxylan esterase [Balneolaceae bacterium]
MSALALVLFLPTGVVKAQDSLKVIRGEASNNHWLQFSDADHSLYHHLTGEALELLDRRSSAVEEIRSAVEWQQRQLSLQQTLMELVGPFPEKTPLNATVTRTVEKEDYRVEHIVFESQPGFFVTSSLFIPSDLTAEPAPAVLYVSGHTNEAYRSSTYQHAILNLVKKGFVVFAIDPVGQGERLEYYDPEAEESTIGGPTSEHSHPGAQAFITGSSQARYMIWDGIRAVDYLVDREEVDPSRIGITGRSGGGTQSAYIAAFDERIQAAAPENYITNFTRLLQSIGPQDAEQNLYHGIAHGIDHADLLTVRAPKPLLIIATTNDFFSIQGVREAAAEVSGIYKAYGQEENFGFVEDIGGHASTLKNRKAMYSFFQQHLDLPGTPEDLDVELLSAEEIRVTRTGQVSESLGSETVFSLNRKEAENRLADLQSSGQDLTGHLKHVRESAKRLSGYREPAATSTPVFTGRFQREGYTIEKYFVKGEGEYVIPYLLLIPEHSNGKAVIYLHPEDKAAEVSEGGEMEWFVRNGFTVLSPDLVGTGEMGSGSPLRLEWRAAIQIGRSIVGIRAGDVVRLTRLLKEKVDTDTPLDIELDEIYGVARRDMAPVLLHAAAFEPDLARILLLGPYSSYRSLVMNRFYEPGFIPSTVAGALTAYDLPDLAATLAPRRLMMAGVTDGSGNPAISEQLKDEFSVIEAAYQEREAVGNFTFTSTSPTRSELFELFEEWLK